MKCPYCSFPETKVVDKRNSEDLESARRRRECLKCSKRFTTYERVELMDITVVKKDGKRAQFDREKVLRGVMRACEKRPISRETMETLVDSIESEIRNQNDLEVSTQLIGQLVMKRLKAIDKVAYIRFASVYREFTDLTSFEKELKKLLKRKKGEDDWDVGKPAPLV